MSSAATILPEFVMADISGCARVPSGRRGYIVVREGTKFATLFCPRTFKKFRLRLDAWDAIDFDRVDYDRKKLLARLEADRAARERDGRFSGGKVLTIALAGLKDAQ